MAKRVPSFADNNGKRHDTAEEATLSDIASILGRLGSDPGLTDGIARKVLDKRTELEAVFAEHDAITAGGERDA